jgi:hypothetical protein
MFQDFHTIPSQVKETVGRNLLRIAKYSYKHLAWIKIAAPWDRGRPAQCRIVFAGRGAEKSDRIVDLDLDLDVDLDGTWTWTWTWT